MLLELHETIASLSVARKLPNQAQQVDRAIAEKFNIIVSQCHSKQAIASHNVRGSVEQFPPESAYRLSAPQGGKRDLVSTLSPFRKFVSPLRHCQ